MENFDDVLEEGKEELTLDRPSVVGNTTELLSSDTPKPPYLHHEESQNGTEGSSTISYLIYDGENPTKEIFHPLSSSEKCVEEEEHLVDDMGNTKKLETITLPPNLISTGSLSKNEKMPNSKKTEKKLTRYPYLSKQPLISCLKSSEKITNEEIRKCGVHFPDSGEYVTEYIDPVDPWRDVRTPSKGEVISFYRNACQKLRCKPIEKVIKQIQERPDLSTRSETLVLRGIRLDIRACEALESVFRRAQFENLDLENCSLEEDGATAILEMVEFYQSTCKLNIACNPKIGMRGWQSLCRMLRKTHVLTYLDARRTLLTDMTMPTFGRCLKADPNLKILHLEGVFLSGRPLLILTTAMKSNKVLEELYLGDNNLTSSDGPPIGAMLTYNTTLQLLDLRNNQMKDVGLAHIGNGLADQSEQEIGGLCSLIMWNNGLTHEGMGYLCEGLIRTTSLKALNLGQNRIGDLGLQKLKGGLIKNKSLRKLGFLNTKLGNEGAVALAEVLADSLSITRIDIRENNVLTAGLMAFSMALKVNNSLLRLDLDKEIKKEPGMETVMQGVLVDVYNLCYRNKQLARKDLSSSSSSISSNEPTLSHTTSFEMNDAISVDDVFHPESLRQEITPFSPADNPKEIVFPEQFTVKKNQQEPIETSTVQKEVDIENSLAPEKRFRSKSDPIGKKSVESAAKPTRSSRFSVTKIFDTFTSGVAHKIASNVAHIDNKFKRQLSKEKLDCPNLASELMPVLEQDGNVEQTTKTERVVREDDQNLNNDINFEILQNSHKTSMSDDGPDTGWLEDSSSRNETQLAFTRTLSAPERITNTKQNSFDDNLECTSETDSNRCHQSSECVSESVTSDSENAPVTFDHSTTSETNNTLFSTDNETNHVISFTSETHSSSECTSNDDLPNSIVSDNQYQPNIVPSSFSSSSFSDSLLNDGVDDNNRSETSFESSEDVILNVAKGGGSMEYDGNADSYCNSIVTTQSLVVDPAT